eukprot:Nitzschia sp. Nitz4//scaffold2_size372955//87439//88839//NITZ4_000384-RA/size372955-processed-gene-0.483-mRNA-1//-1//CDS//3329546659//4837//frame0
MSPLPRHIPMARGVSTLLGARFSTQPSKKQLIGKFNNALQNFSHTRVMSTFPIPESLRQSVKSAVLDQVGGEDGHAWSSPEERHINGVNHELVQLFDPLEDLYRLEMPTYWPNLPSGVDASADPFALSKADLDTLSTTIREDMLGTSHPVLSKAAEYFFANADGGKKVRPMMVFLLSRALADSMGATKAKEGSTLFTQPLEWQRQDLPEAQRRLAEITEIFHTSSLFHDDVIDGSDTRRGEPTVHKVFGNKMAILAGDYLLARASVCLARLRNLDVVESMSTVIEHLVRGEVMQMRGTSGSERNERMIYYLKKNYYKTSSLMANSCRSAALLAGCKPEMVSASYRYGKHVGMAFQLVDDVLDFEGNIANMGKPALADLNAGLATAPVFFAAEKYPELGTLMDRKFKEAGDVPRAQTLVLDSDGLERTKQLARVHAELAMDAVLELEPGQYRDALVNLAFKVVTRTA